MSRILFVLTAQPEAAACLAASLATARAGAVAFPPSAPADPAPATLAPDPEEVARVGAVAVQALGGQPADRLPAGGLRAGLVAALADLLASADADGGPLVLARGPVAPLLPLWREAAARVGRQAHAVVLLSPPPPTASGPAPAPGPWLRRMLEAERHSRDLPRLLLPAEAVLRDPTAAARQVCAALGLPAPDPAVPTQPRRKGAAPASPPQTAPAESDRRAEAAFAALCRLAEAPEDPVARAQLDALWHDSEAWPVSCPPAPPACAAAPPVEVAFAHSLAEAGVLRARMAASATVQAAQRREIDALRHRLQVIGSALWTVDGVLHRTWRAPWLPWRLRLEARVLRALSRWHPPLSTRRTACYARMAAQRDPGPPEVPEALRRALTVCLPAPLRALRRPGARPGPAEGPAVLVVCADAQPTEANAQALALAWALGTDHRVHVLFLTEAGSLVPDFAQAAAAVWSPDQPLDPAPFADAAVAQIVAEAAPAFAVTASVEARHALPVLRRAGLRSVALLPEPASLCAPVTVVSDTVRLADRAVFPARMALQDAMATDYLCSPGRSMHVLPPAAPVPAPAPDPAEAHRLSALLRPAGLAERRFVVLGGGPVAYDQGADLFVETACAVLSRPGGRAALFVWSGPGFDPGRGGYAAHLLGQMRRKGVEDRVLFLPETTCRNALHALADAFVLPARHAPLASDALAAMRAGLPVLCFDGATGVAEHLTAAGLEGPCVAGFLDVPGLAGRLGALAASAPLRAEVAARTQVLAARRFDPAALARGIVALGGPEGPGRDEDAETILGSPGFDPGFCLGAEGHGLDRRTAVARYLEGTRSGLDMRKPEPGFHPLVFARAHAGPRDRGRDPYAEFLRLGRPEGPWLSRVIVGGPDAPPPLPAPAVVGEAPSGLRAALHIHGYFTDQLADIAARLQANAARPDLFVSVADAGARQAAADALAGYSGAVRAIEPVPNLGRDIGPFLTLFGPRLVDGYDVVGHVHTKKSTHAADAEMVRRWVDLTLSGVLGGGRAGPMADRILATFAADGRLGVAYPDDPHVFGWTANRGPAQAVLDRLGHGPAPEAFNFPAGTMFWMRSDALRPLVGLGLDWCDYPAEPLANDGTLLHALERLFGVLPMLDGWTTAVTVTPGQGR